MWHHHLKFQHPSQQFFWVFLNNFQVPRNRPNLGQNTDIQHKLMKNCSSDPPSKRPNHAALNPRSGSLTGCLYCLIISHQNVNPNPSSSKPFLVENAVKIATTREIPNLWFFKFCRAKAKTSCSPSTWPPPFRKRRRGPHGLIAHSIR